MMKPSNLCPQRIFAAFVVTALSVISAGVIARAQTTGAATINGAINDANQAAIPAATVTVIDVDTGVQHIYTTDSAGLYSAPFLIPGHYEVDATAASFNKVQEKGITLQVGETLTINLSLKVSGANTTVEALQVAGARVERHQGLEVESQWKALPNLQLRANATLMDARTTQAVDPAWVGKPATNVAPLAVSLQEAWAPRALPGATWLNVGTYSGHKAVLPDGSVDLPDYWQWDTALRYEWTRAGLHWTGRAGIDNVTDRHYWREAPMATWGSIYLFPAAARSARLGISVSW